MKGLEWVLLAVAVTFLVGVVLWLVTLPGCSELVGAGYCWGNQ